MLILARLFLTRVIDHGPLVFGLILLFFTPSAFAKTVHLSAHSDTWTLYTIGNGDMIAAILFGLQSLMKSTAFRHFINLMLLMGFGGLLLSHIADGRLLLTRLVQHLLLTGLFLRLLFGLTISIGLIDSVDPQYDRVVTHVPFLIGAPACFLSFVGHVIAAQLDEAYSQHARLPLSLTMTGGSAKGANGASFNIGAHMIQDGAQYSIGDPLLKNSLTHFIVDCVTPLIGSGKLRTAQLLTSANLWGLLDSSSLNPAIMTLYYDYRDPSVLGQVMTCRQAYAQLNQDLQRAKPEFVSQWSQDITTGAAASLFQTVLTYTARQSHYTPSPGSYLQQAALLHIFQGPVFNLMALQSNSPLLMQGLSTQQAIQTARTSWTTSATVFQATFGYLYAALQTLIYAMAPMVVALMLLPGLRVLIMRRYLQLLAWFPVTLILLAITNDMLLYWTIKTVSQAWREHSGLSIVGAPFISARAANMAAVGAWLITLVPMIAWGLVAGLNLAITNLLGTTGIEGAANNAATQMVTGNASLDNQNYNNFAANKFSSLMKTDIGAMPVSSYISGSNLLEEKDLGGLLGLKNGEPLKNPIHKRKEVEIKDSSQTIQSTAEQESSSDMTELSQSANTSAEATHKTTERLHAAAKGGLLAGVLSGSLQKTLADNNYNGVDKATVAHVARDLEKATVAHAESIDAQSQGHPEQEKRFIQESKAAFSHAFHRLSDQLGGGRKGDLSATALLGGGLLGAVVSDLHQGNLISGEGSLGIDTESIHGNKTESNLGARKSKQATKQHLASTEERIGLLKTVTTTTSYDESSREPNAELAKAEALSLPTPAQSDPAIQNNTSTATPHHSDTNFDPTIKSIHKEKQALPSKKNQIHEQVLRREQQAKQAINERAKATQAEELFTFKSPNSAKKNYINQEDI